MPATEYKKNEVKTEQNKPNPLQFTIASELTNLTVIYVIKSCNFFAITTHQNCNFYYVLFLYTLNIAKSNHGTCISLSLLALF